MEQSGISSDLIRGHIDTIILYSIIDKDKYAQQISDSIETQSDYEYKINQATLYSSLKRLETLKYVKAYWNDCEDGRRKYYHLTDFGKSVIKENLDNWSHSREIINKLIGCPQKETQKVVCLNNSPPIHNDSVSRRDNLNFLDAVNNPASPNVNAPASQSQTQESPVQISKDNDFNYKTVINSLMKDVEKNSIKPDNNSSHIDLVSQPITDEESVEDFNDTIINNTISTDNYDDKIDFGDMILKANSENYKIKVSSKDSAMPKGFCKINKINLILSISIWLALFSQILVIYFNSGNLINFTKSSVITLCVLVTLYPLISLVICLKKPNKPSFKIIGVDSILKSFIVVFNLFLLTFACAFLFDLDFKNGAQIIKYIIIPCVCYLDVVLFFALRYIYSKLKIFNAKK